MAEAQLRQFLDKVRQLNAFVALSEADPRLRQELRDCDHHDQVVALARRCGFEIGRRWGEPPAGSSQPAQGAGTGLQAAAGPGGGPAPSEAALQAAARPARDGEAPPEARLAVAAAPETLSGACSEPRPVGEGSSALSMAPVPESADGSVHPERREGRAPLFDRASHPTAVASGLLDCCDPPHSLLAGPCPPPGEERTEVLLETRAWRLERIHSCDCSSPEGFWYEQPEHEWVMLLQGTAGLRFADQPGDLVLRPGDSLWIRAGRRHRVTATDPAPGTIWLALFWWTA